MAYVISISSGESANGVSLNFYNAPASPYIMYIFSGGTANRTSVSDGSVFVSSGGTANSTTVNYIGEVFIYTGGITNATTVNSAGYIYVSSGGIANNTVIKRSGGGYLYDSGTANSTTLNGGYLRVYNGGSANNTVVSSGGSLFVDSGGTADNTAIKNFGKVFVSSGGAANNTTVSYGSMFVLSGGVTNSTTVSPGGRLFVSSGGTATDIDWTPCIGKVSFEEDTAVTFVSKYTGVYYGSGNKLLSNDLMMDSVTIDTDREMYVMSNGSGNDITVDYGGSLCVFSEGTATEIKENGGYVNIKEGAKVSFVSHTISGLTLSNSAAATLHSNTIANSTTIDSLGSMVVYSCGITNSTSVKSCGSMFISSGGSANNTVVHSSGFLCVSSGGTAAHIIAYSGARLDFSIAPNTYIEGAYGDSAFEIKNGVATYYSINAGITLRIMSGGVARRTNIINGGDLYVTMGGIASRTTINEYGRITVCFDGVVEDVVISSGYGYNGDGIIVSSGGTAINTSVYSGGCFRLSSGGTGKKITVNRGYLTVDSGGIADEISVQDYGEMYVASGGTATNIIASSTQLLFDIAPDTYIAGTNFGSAFEIKNGIVSNYVVNGRGLNICSGGTANDVTINYGYGSVSILSSGSAINTIVNAGSLYVSSGGMVNSTTVNGGCFNVYSGGKASNTTVFTGRSVFIGGMADNTEICRGGSMSLNGGIASDIKINSGGELTVEQAKLTGKITIEDGGIVHAGQGAIVDFDISGIAPGMVPRVNNLSPIQDNAPAFTLTVSDLQWNGTYKLAKGAEDFDNLISVKSLSNETIHMVEVGETVNIDGIEYTLNLTGDTLSVIVTGGRDIPIIPVSADITEFTNQDVTLTAGFSDDAIMREYSFDNETWHVYTESVKCSENGTVFFLGKNQRGFVNEIASYEVTNIDTTPPSTPSDQTSEINGYTVDLSWSAASDTGGGAIKYEYRIATDNTYSQITKSGTTETCSVTVDNLKYGTYYWSVCAMDAAGNTSDWSVSKTFTTVDAVAPDVPTNLVCLVENITTLSVNWDEVSDDSLGCGLNRYEIQLANDEAFSSIVKSFSTTETAATMEALSKGDYYLRVCAVDNTGNKSDWTAAESFTIETDTIPPTISDIKADITEPTKENVTVTATFNDNYALETSQYKIGNDGEWTDYKNGVIVTENAVVYFRAVDTTGNETEATYEVKNIDRIKPVITLDGNTQTPVQQTTLTASTDDGSAILYRINNSGEWTTYTGTIAVLANASYSFKATDAAGNTGTAEITFENIDTTHPVLTLTADTVTLSNSVTLTAETNEETVISYSSDNINWTTYDSPLEIKVNGRYYFKATDTAGNTGTAEIEFKNIDAVAPTDPSGLDSIVSGQKVAFLWNGSTDDFSGVKEYVVTYSINDQVFSVRTSNTNYVLNNADFGSYSWSVQAVDFAGNESAATVGEAFTVSGFKPYTVEYSADNFEHVITFAITTPSLDAFRMPTGTYQMRVKQEGSSEWLTGDSIIAPERDIEPQLIKSDADGNADVFFANTVGTWESGYLAQHVGSINDWAGTNEYASVSGKNKLADIIEGSTDANILLMTDDDNGDTLFVDDIYTASPGNVAEKQSRIAQIDEIRAGAGADIVDMTSQRFEYIGEGLTIRGGEGNDTIWANKGDNFLFGDAGNDRIVGASGNDVIVGGIGNDRMHGGGGSDTFTFCENWGIDTVEQLAAGSVTLWFASGSMENWNESTLTYTDGDNSVKVSGVTVEQVKLKFGDDGSDQFATLSGMGAFFDATTERIFEESSKGILASL